MKVLCKCGCGEIPKKGSKYIFNHHRRGKVLSEEHKKKTSESLKGHKHSEETCRKISESNKGKESTEEAKRNMSIAQFKRFENPKNHYNWQGGISKEPYGIEFNDKLRGAVRNKYNNTCQLCSKEESENGRKLDVHHIDYDKKNNNEDNLIPLCVSCHTKTTNSNREEYKKQLKELII